MSTKLNYEQWYELRNLVLDAVYAKKLNAPPFDGFDEITELVKAFLQGDKAAIDEAACKVVALCPVGSKEAASKHPWLLLEKS